MNTDELKAAWATEGDKQVKALYDAMFTALMKEADKFDTPMLNAIAAAISMLHAEILALVPPGKHRKTIAAMMGRIIIDGVRDNEHVPKVEVLDVDTLKN